METDLLYVKYLDVINDISFDGIVIHDGKRFIACNKQFEKITGYASEELKGKSIFSIVDPPSRKITRKNIKKDYYGVYEIELRHKDGGIIPCSIRGRTTNIDGGTIRIAMVRDIKALIEDERQLIESEKKYKNLFDHAGDAVFLLKHLDGKNSDFMIDDSNARARRLFGYTKKELSEMIFEDLFPQETIEDIPDLYEDLLKKGTLSAEVNALKKDGKSFPVSITATLYEIEDKINVTIIIKDLTKTEKSRERARSTAKFPEENPNPVARVSKELKYMYSNSSWKYSFRNWDCNIDDDIPTFLVKPVKDLFKEKGTKKKTVELEVDGDFFMFDMVFIKDTGYINIYAREITERIKVEKELKYLSFHDKLTGLFNRAFFEAELKRLNTERQLPLSIIIGDVNGLKLVNDAFGHKEGDLLLRKAAEVFEKSCRKDDVISRYGGDEFAILLPSTPEDMAVKILNRIRSNNADVSGLKIPLSLALGYATKNHKDEKIMTVFKEAEDRMYRRKLTESKGTTSNIITSIEKMLTEKSFETKEHAGRLKKMSIKLGKKLGLKDSQIDELVLLSTLHDIGKVAVPEDILFNPGELSKKDWEKIKKHPEIGFSIAQESILLAAIAEAILSHHEWWDGSGYPQGLKAKDIPITSRILAIVDAYDVMRNGRPYKKPMSKKESIKELKRFSGKQFDPNIVKRFLKIIK